MLSPCTFISKYPYCRSNHFPDFWFKYLWRKKRKNSNCSDKIVFYFITFHSKQKLSAEDITLDISRQNVVKIRGIYHEFYSQRFSLYKNCSGALRQKKGGIYSNISALLDIFHQFLLKLEMIFFLKTILVVMNDEKKNLKFCLSFAKHRSSQILSHIVILILFSSN